MIASQSRRSASEVMPYWLLPFCAFLFLIPFEMLLAGLKLSLPVNGLGLGAALLIALAAPRGHGAAWRLLLSRYVAVSALALTMFLSYFSSLDPSETRNMLIPAAIAWGIYLLTTSRALSPFQVECGLRAWFWGGGAAALFTIACSLMGIHGIDGRGSMVVGSVEVDPNFLTASFLLPSAMGLYYLHQRKRRVEALLILGLIVWATTLAQSRGGVLALFCLGGAFLLWERRWKLGLLLLACLASLYLIFAPMLGRFQAGEDTSGNGRTEVWQIALVEGAQQGPTGVGLGAFHHVTGSTGGFYWSLATHNTYLQAFAETGSLGALALLLVMGIHLRFPERSRLAGALFSALIGLAVAALFLHFMTFKVLWAAWIVATQAVTARPSLAPPRGATGLSPALAQRERRSLMTLQPLRLLLATLIGSALLLLPLTNVALASEYVLRSGDALSVSVVGHPELAVPAQPIRPDGQISLPMIPPVKVEGRSIPEVSATIQASYRSILTNPRVLVSIASYRPLRVTVLGKVERAGSFDFSQPPTLIEAIATAGGLNRRAARNAISVLEPTTQTRRQYDLDRLLNGREPIPTLPEGGIVEVGEVWGPDVEIWLPLVTSLITAIAFIRTWD